MRGDLSPAEADPAGLLPLELGRAEGFVIVLCPAPRPDLAAPPGFFSFRQQRLLAWSNRDGINPLDGLLFGWALGQRGPVLGPLNAESLQIALPGLDLESGQYCMVKAQGTGLELTADPFGLSVIFHGSIGGYVFCSNRLHLIAEAARRLGLRLSLNRAAVLGQLCVDAYIAKASNTRWTPLDGIEYAMPGDRLQLDCERGLRVARSEPDLSQIAEQDYAIALGRATDRYVAQLESLARDSETISLSLTAGYDSRLVLGGLLAAGARSRIRTWTRPIDLADSLGAQLISAQFGLQPRDFAAEPLAAEPAQMRVARHRSLSFLLTHKLPDIEPVQKYFPAGVCVSGGGGESLRAVNGVRYPKGSLAAAPYSLAATQEWLLTLGRAPLFEPQDFDALLDLFHREFLATPGSSLIEKLEWNDFQHGNRFHFAPQMPQLAPDRLLVCGAVSPDLRRLALRMPFAERRDKRLLHDVFARLQPRLLEIPFTSAWNTDIKAHPDRYAPPPETRPDWYVARERAAKADLQAVAGPLAEAALARLCDGSEFAGFLQKFAVPKLAWYRKTGGHGFQTIWWSRLLGMQDVLDYCAA